MNYKKFVVYVTLATLLLAALAAAAQDEPFITPVPCDEPGQLTMWVWDENWARVISSAIDVWVENYCPGAQVNLQQQPWGQYWDLLRTNVAGGSLPDVFNMSQTFFYDYASNEVLLPLDEYLEAAGVDTSIWGSGMVDPYRFGEEQRLYAVPVNWDTVGIYYNKDMFDAAGVPYPTSDWTWDDFAAAAAALTDPENDVYGAAVYAGFQTGYPNWIAATGVSPAVAPGRAACTLTEPGSLEALNFLADLQAQGYMPSISIMGGAGADDAFNFWLAGRVAMISGGSWKLPDATAQATFNWDVVQFPRHPETGRTRSILHAVGYVAAANTPNPDLAANLIIFLGSDEAQAFFAQAGGVAPANPGLQDEWLAGFAETGINAQAFVNAIEDSQGVTIFGEIWDVVNNELPINIFDLGVSVEEATQMACEFIETQLPQ